HYVRSYVATQADKMQLAIEAMNEIMNEMPQAEEQFIQSLDASRKKIESERITRTGIYWSREAAAKRGLNYDIRQDAYEALSGMSLYDLNRFFEEHIADRTYTYLVIGDKNKLDMDYLRSLGEFKELTLEEIFGY
ncbi:MAG TPA: insulinase family protein, partial [Chitinophagales bacterium]|nr:insulinase family protein [Chitinophagales bacterium]